VIKTSSASSASHACHYHTGAKQALRQGNVCHRMFTYSLILVPVVLSRKIATARSHIYHGPIRVGSRKWLGIRKSSLLKYFICHMPRESVIAVRLPDFCITSVRCRNNVGNVITFKSYLTKCSSKPGLYNEQLTVLARDIRLLCIPLVTTTVHYLQQLILMKLHCDIAFKRKQVAVVVIARGCIALYSRRFDTPLRYLRPLVFKSKVSTLIGTLIFSAFLVYQFVRQTDHTAHDAAYT